MDEDALDQHQMDSYVAMILVSLPLPPLPVVVLKGADAEDGTCSSHDLHAVMLRTHMHMMHTNAYSHQEQLSHMDAKTAALEDLCTKLTGTLQDNTEQTGHVADCYAHLCSAFRQYAAAYAHTCTDVRILPLDTVVPGDTVHTQTCAYVSAYMQDTTPGTDDRDLTYECLLRKWLKYVAEHLD
jgi:hypothetical protein